MTKIEWTHRPGTIGESWNPIRAHNLITRGSGHFCIHVSEGCRNCYAERVQPRFRNPIRYAKQDQHKVECFLDEYAIKKPLHWEKPRTIFVCSMTDLFGEWVETGWVDRIFRTMALCPQHTFILLTKRAERMRSYISDIERPWQQPNPPWTFLNVWCGVSVEDQATADARIPTLLQTPAAVRFVSYEPALGPVDFKPGEHLDWVICGGEFGPKARPMHPDWAQAVRDQCAETDTPFFFKGWGEWSPVPLGGFKGRTGCLWPDGEWIEGPIVLTMRKDVARVMVKVGKKRAGRLLDGSEYSQWPGDLA